MIFQVRILLQRGDVLPLEHDEIQLATFVLIKPRCRIFDDRPFNLSDLRRSGRVKDK